MILSAGGARRSRARRPYFADIKAVIAQTEGWKRHRDSACMRPPIGRRRANVAAFPRLLEAVVLDDAAEKGARGQACRVPPGCRGIIGDGDKRAGHPLRANADVFIALSAGSYRG